MNIDKVNANGKITLAAIGVSLLVTLGGLAVAWGSLNTQVEDLQERFDRYERRHSMTHERWEMRRARINDILVNHNERISRIEGDLYPGP